MGKVIVYEVSCPVCRADWGNCPHSRVDLEFGAFEVEEEAEGSE